MRLESTGTLAASGLIAGESLTGVVLAGMVLVSERFTSIGGLLGLPERPWVDGPVGAWLALVPLAALAWSARARAACGDAARGSGAGLMAAPPLVLAALVVAAVA